MKLILSIACLIALPLTTAAVAKPDFNGTWVLDTNRSFSNPPGLEQTMTVVQTDSQITVDAKIKTQQGEQKINETYKLDGAEADFTPPGGQPGAKGKRKAMWLPGARGVVIETWSLLILQTVRLPARLLVNGRCPLTVQC